MAVKAFQSPTVPATTELSQIVTAGPLVFLSGQVGVGPDGEIVSPKADEQIVQAFNNVESLLHQIGASMDNVIKVTSYLVDLSSKPTLHRVRRQHFAPPYPASTLLVVKQLASPAYLFEVDIVASLEEPRTAAEAQDARRDALT